jgi:hypothetical protein
VSGSGMNVEVSVLVVQVRAEVVHVVVALHQ